MSPTPVRLAILGCSRIAQRSILPALCQSTDFELSYLGSRNLATAEPIARKFGAKAAGYELILADDSSDAVYVSTPVGLHAAWGRAVVESGKHLLLEKTFSAQYEEGKTIVAMAEASGLVAKEALMYVFHPLYQKVQALIAEGLLGEIRHIEAGFAFPHIGMEDIRYRRDLGGGAVLDALIYPLSLALNVVGELPIHCAWDKRSDDKYEVDTACSMQLSWPGCTAHLVCGFGFMYRNAYRIWGSEGYLTVDRAFSRPADLAGQIDLTLPSGTQQIEVDPADHFTLMLADFARAIRGDGYSGINAGAEILNRLKIIAATANSSQHVGFLDLGNCLPDCSKHNRAGE